VGEGVAEMLTTVPYLNASFAFVTRTADDIIIESLDDPRVRELRIGTYQSAIPTIALRNRGIVENVKEYAAIVRPTGVDAHSPILDGLLSEEVDVAIVYGPFAAARASEESGELTVTVLQPEVDLGAALLQLSRILTIGVRSQDEALRDDLNRALANRWDDVNAILDAYGIPRFDVSRPRVSDELAGATKIGAIFPAGTPAALPHGPVGDDALRGIRVAENVLSERGATTTGFLVLRAHAPTLESIERAARRMVAVDGVNALVGGYTPAAALALATIATELHVPFFNVGSESDALRSPTCFPHTFHIAPSTSMMVVGSLATIGNRAASVFAVLERDGYEDETTQFIERVLAANGADLTVRYVVEPDQYGF